MVTSGVVINVVTNVFKPGLSLPLRLRVAWP